MKAPVAARCLFYLLKQVQPRRGTIYTNLQIFKYVSVVMGREEPRLNEHYETT